MPLKKHKPTSPGRRFSTWSDFAEVTKTEPEKSLVEGLKKSGGRNSNGRKTSRHRGGGAKRLYRKIDFKRTKDGVPARVAAIEYDPNRSAYIALLHYADGEKAYILAPNRLQVGMTVESGPTADIAVGNALPLMRIPVGTVVHNVELQPGRGARWAFSAASSTPAACAASCASSWAFSAPACSLGWSTLVPTSPGDCLPASRAISGPSPSRRGRGRCAWARTPRACGRPSPR